MSGKNTKTPPKFLKLFGETYFSICKKQQQEKIADYCGVSRQAIYQWVRGMSAIPLFRFIQFCEFYGFDAGQELSSIVKKWKTINKTFGGNKNAKRKAK